MPTVEIAASTLSYWGRMMTDLRAWGWSYGGVAREVGVTKSRLHQMVTDPNYQPGYSLGQRFRRFYLRQARARRSANRTTPGV